MRVFTVCLFAVRKRSCHEIKAEAKTESAFVDYMKIDKMHFFVEHIGEAPLLCWILEYSDDVTKSARFASKVCVQRHSHLEKMTIPLGRFGIHILTVTKCLW